MANAVLRGFRGLEPAGRQMRGGFAGRSLPRLAAAGAAVAAGMYLRARRNRRAFNRAGQSADAP